MSQSPAALDRGPVCIGCGINRCRRKWGDRPVKRGKRIINGKQWAWYCKPGCAGGLALRAIPHEVRSARSKAIQARIHPLAQRKQLATARRMMLRARWLENLERWQDMPIRDALRDCYWHGYNAGYNRARRKNKADVAA